MNTMCADVVVDRTRLLQLRPRKAILQLDALLPMHEPPETMDLVLSALVPPDVVDQTCMEVKTTTSEDICEVVHLDVVAGGSAVEPQCVDAEQQTEIAGETEDSVPRIQADALCIACKSAAVDLSDSIGIESTLTNAETQTTEEVATKDEVEAALQELGDRCRSMLRTKQEEWQEERRGLLAQIRCEETAPRLLNTGFPVRVAWVENAFSVGDDEVLQYLRRFGTILAWDVPGDRAVGRAELRVWMSSAAERLRLMGPQHYLRSVLLQIRTVLADNAMRSPG